MWLKLTDHLWLFPAFIRSENSKDREGEKKKSPVGGTGNLLEEQRTKPVYTQLLYLAAKKPRLRENPSSHFIRKKKTRQWKDVNTMGSTFGELWLHENKPLSQRSDKHGSCEKGNCCQVRALNGNDQDLEVKEIFLWFLQCKSNSLLTKNRKWSHGKHSGP